MKYLNIFLLSVLLMGTTLPNLNAQGSDDDTVEVMQQEDHEKREQLKRLLREYTERESVRDDEFGIKMKRGVKKGLKGTSSSWLFSLVPKFGVNVSEIDFNEKSNSSETELRDGVNFGLGLDFNFGLIGVSLDCLYMMKGGDIKDTDFEIKHNLNYLTFPLIVKLNIINSMNFGLSIGAGLEIGLYMDGFSEENDDQVAIPDWANVNLNDNADDLESVLPGLPLELQLEVYNFIFNFRYNIGMGNVFSDTEATMESIIFTTGYKITF
jgi:hypothetical protein